MARSTSGGWGCPMPATSLRLEAFWWPERFMFLSKASRVNSISEAERPKRSRVAPSEAIPTFLPYPRPEAGSDQALQGRSQGKVFIHPEFFFPGPSCLVLCWYSENTFIDRDWDFIFWVIQWSSAEILLQSGYKQSPTHNQKVYCLEILSSQSRI